MAHASTFKSQHLTTYAIAHGGIHCGAWQSVKKQHEAQSLGTPQSLMFSEQCGYNIPHIWAEIKEDML